MGSAQERGALALHTLYRDHHAWLRQVLRRRLGNSADAEDLAHDAFVRLMRVHAPPVLGNAGQARAYLHAMARNLCITFWRRRELERAWLEALAARPPDCYPSAERQAAVLQALEEVLVMLQSLRPKVAQAFVLAEVHQMSDAEVAARIGVSDRTVRSHVAQAMLACLKLQARCSVHELAVERPD